MRKGKRIQNIYIFYESRGFKEILKDYCLNIYFSSKLCNFYIALAFILPFFNTLDA